MQLSTGKILNVLGARNLLTAAIFIFDDHDF